MKEEKVVAVGFRLSEKLAREFKTMCVSRGTTIQFVLTKAVEEYLAKEKEKSE